MMEEEEEEREGVEGRGEGEDDEEVAAVDTTEPSADLSRRTTSEPSLAWAAGKAC